MVRTNIDVGDTSQCPVGEVCQGCRLALPDRRVWTADTPVGVVCLTLCDACQVLGTPRLSMIAAVHAGLEHCAHIGITVDEMAALLEAELNDNEAEDTDGR